MRVIVFVKATDDSEKGILPTAELLEAMGRFNDELRNSGILGRVIKPGARAGFHAERSEWHARGAVGADRARSRSDECVPRLLVTVLPA